MFSYYSFIKDESFPILLLTFLQFILKFKLLEDHLSYQDESL